MPFHDYRTARNVCFDTKEGLLFGGLSPANKINSFSAPSAPRVEAPTVGCGEAFSADEAVNLYSVKNTWYIPLIWKRILLLSAPVLPD